VEARVLVRPVKAVGTVAVDERRLTIVTLRAEAYVEEMFVDTTGRQVKKGEPLFRIYSSQIQSAQTDFLVALGASNNRILGIDPEANLRGGMQRLRNLDVPEWRIEEIRKTRDNPRTIDWPSPATGTILSKKVIKGQRVMPGDELYRIADLSTGWIIADVAEADLALLHVGTRAKVTLRAYPNDPVEGQVTLIYPELKTETRTARVRIEVPNPDLRLKTDMYADVEFRAGASDVPVVAVPDSAVIDDGKQQIVLVAKDEGRFEPRPVKLGRHGEGFREVVSGLNEGDEIVTSANFLIDAESNLRPAR
jgi:Cu(I)/Ag(I) efflux system membrane fusion protein